MSHDHLKGWFVTIRSPVISGWFTIMRDHDATCKTTLGHYYFQICTLTGSICLIVQTNYVYTLFAFIIYLVRVHGSR